LFLLDLGNNANRMGGSALDQTCNINNNEPPKINNLNDLNNFFNCTQALIKNNVLNAYHDKSDGGLITTIIEMGFASNMSIKLNKLNLTDEDLYKFLFNEELGCVFAVSKNNKNKFFDIIKKYKLDHLLHELGLIKKEKNPLLDICEYNYTESMSNLRKYWSELSYLIQSKRDSQKTAKEEYNSKINFHNDVIDQIGPKITYTPLDKSKKYLALKHKPKMAIFREQGVNGHKEMANAFRLAGFDCYDINTNDIINNPEILNTFRGLVA